MSLIMDDVNEKISLLQRIMEKSNLDDFRAFFRKASSTFKPAYNDKLTGCLLNKDYQYFANPELLGKITHLNDNLELPIFAFKVKSQLTERSSKKLQYEKGKHVLKTRNDTAGIFIFYDDAGSFRLSLIRAIYLGTKRDFSHYKRYTYFVSKDEPNKTFLTRIGNCNFASLDSIQETFSVEPVTKAFYEEIANWYFWALKLTKFPQDAETEPNGRNIAVIRLITRMIFIWFMRQKNIIHKKLFDKEVMDNILQNLAPEESTYYKAILQNLFFATLNTPIEQRKFRRERRFQGKNDDYMNHSYYRYHSLFKDPSQMEELFNEIPFLNGGLFECLDKKADDPANPTRKELRIDGFSDEPKKQPIVPNKLFFAQEEDVDLSQYYGEHIKNYTKSYKVRGLINILSSYNFTTDENTPLDEEIALDPELLGRVFENLLASYNPETSTTARKATGSYYTPRKIVEFMIKEALKAYITTTLNLNNDSQTNNKLEELFSYDATDNLFDEATSEKIIKAIHNLKLLDPAVGSGAFPIGALQLLVRALHKLDPENKKWKAEQIEAAKQISDPKIKEETIRMIEENFSANELDYGRKLYLIQNCLYGVDIQPIAIHIAKLRCFISLIVDEKKDPSKPNLGIEPLPNLETKFICANTLIKLYSNNKTIDSQLTFAKNKKVILLQQNLQAIRSRYFTASLTSEKQKLRQEDIEIRKAIMSELTKSPFYQEENKWQQSIEKIHQWDPYNTNISANWFDPEWMFGIKDGFDIIIGNPPYIQLQNEGGKLAKLYQSQGYQVFARTGDIYCLFYEKGMQLLKEKGLLCYITSNKWMRAGYGEKLRNFFTQYNPILLIDLGPSVFENATVDTSILLIQKSSKVANDNLSKLTPHKPLFHLKALTIKSENEIDISGKLSDNYGIIEKLSGDAWFIGSSAEQKLKEKIERIGKPLKDWDVKIYRGVLTGLNEAFIISTEKRNEILAACRNEAERQRTEAIIKPILRGRDIKRYYYEWAGLWVIVIPAGWTNKFKGNEKPEDFVKKQFPSLMDYLTEFEEKAKKRDDQGDYWWELRKCAYYEEFEKEKVVWGNISYNSEFCFVEGGIFINAPANLITSENTSTKYLVSLMNSKIFDWQFKQVGIFLGHAYEWKKQYVELVKIPPITPANKPMVLQIEELVDKILAAKSQNPQAATSELEREIDSLVYKLYDLTEEEVRIVEKDK